MGKPRGRKAGQNGEGRAKKGVRDTRVPGGKWVNLAEGDQSNKHFETYYKTQGTVPEAEWDDFITSLRTELPVTFRVTGSRAHAETINETIGTDYVPHLQNVELDGKTYGPPSQISWYPGQLAWQVSAPKRVVRKTEPYRRFQRFLVGETEVGNLSRQEAVSMIPPLFLDVEPHHACLDMCAAPGSKTAQIIEALNPHHTSSSGILIANDSDYKRTHMLVHQTGRMPSRSLVVTNLDATLIPNISLGGGKTLQFDRILADVPCSGDGTLRKNLEIWNKWGVNDGNSLHGLQLRILDRAMNLLKPGGRLVYSTCSFNPVENEAVIAAALKAHAGTFHLLDVSTRLPTLKRRPGISSWKVATRTDTPDGTSELIFHDTHAAYLEAVADGRVREREKAKSPVRTLWAPEGVEELGLERCLRLLPHDQDTGGFFVCVLQKSDTLPSQSASSLPAQVDIPEGDIPETVVVADETGTGTLKRPLSPGSGAEGGREGKRSALGDGGGVGEADITEVGEVVQPKQKEEENGQGQEEEGDETKEEEGNDVENGENKDKSKGKGKRKEQKPKKIKRDLSFKEEGYSFVDPNRVEVKSIVDWFGLKPSFGLDNLLVRNEYGDPLRTIYMTNDLVKTILLNNDYTRLRIVSAGVKSFIRQDAQNRTDIDCKWRIPIEGVHEALPHIDERVVKNVGLEELRVLVEEQYPPVDLFREASREWMSKADVGGYLLRFAAGEAAGGHLSQDIVLPVWKAKTSLSLLIDKREKSMLSLRTFGEDICKAIPNKKTAGKEEEDKAVVGVEGEEGSGGVGLVGEEAVVAEQEEITEEDAINA